MSEGTSAAGARSAHAARVGAHVEGVVNAIGPRLQRLRRQQRLSLQQLAARADVSAAAIHKIERNDMVPTITTLLKVAAALEKPVSYFIEPEDGVVEPATLIRADDRPAVFTPHRGLHLAGISGPYAQFAGAAAVATVAPGADSGDKPLSHPGEELVHVTGGCLVFEIAGVRYELGEGDTIHFVGDQPHHWFNEQQSAATAIWFALRES